MKVEKFDSFEKLKQGKNVEKSEHALSEQEYLELVNYFKKQMMSKVKQHEPSSHQ